MKQEWKPDDMRANAEEIRSAVMPKSVTPEMVGGTLLGLVNAVGEVVEVLGEIPREHVRVRVRGCDGESEVSAAGATVWLDVFAVGGFPTHAFPRQELAADENGVVEFDVPHGYKYALFSQIDGLGASFQLVFDATVEHRDVRLWNFPVGVWALGHTDLANYDAYGDGTMIEKYTAVPWITSNYMKNVPEEIATWAQETAEYPDYEGWWYVGVLVSTADTTFAIGQNNTTKEPIRWCDNYDYNTMFPLLDYYVSRHCDPYDWDEAVAHARSDMDGNMNTAKILGFSPTHIAARWAASSESEYDEQRFLPSAGQLYIMWLNRNAINEIMQEYMDDGQGNYNLLPYQDEKGAWTKPNGRNEWWWSSTVLGLNCSWVVYYRGYIYYNLSDTTNDVRAVSAFHFEY